MRRVSVVGNAGSGKSTVAARLAAALGVTHVELDAVHHLPGWTPIDRDEFRAAVDAATTGHGWVVDGNYREVVVEGPVWARADTVVWLDLPKSTVMRQVTFRSVRRVVRSEELWNGNREQWRNLVRWEPRESMIRWAWTQHAKYRARFGGAMVDPHLAHLTWVRLTSRRAVAAWLREVEARR